MAKDEHCSDHDDLIRDSATAAANTRAILQGVGEIKKHLATMNGRVRGNELAIATVKAWAVGAGAVGGLVLTVVVLFVNHWLAK